MSPQGDVERGVVRLDHEVEFLLKREQQRRGRERVGLMLMVLGLVGAGVCLALGHAGLLWGHKLTVGSMSMAAVSVVGAIAVLVWRRGKNARRLETLIGRRDRLQRGRNDQVYAVSIAAWGLVGAGLTPLTRIARGVADGSDVIFVATLPLLALLILLSVSGWQGIGNGLGQQNRKWLEDELTRAMRGRAMAMGFPVLMVAMGTIYLLGLWRPEWAVVAVPVALIGSASVVGLRFAWLDHQAEAGDD